MTAKEYLLQYQKLRNVISGKKYALAELRSLADGVKAIRYDKDKVQSSPDGDGLLDTVIRIDELSREIDKTCAEAASMMNEIDDRINRLDDVRYIALLKERYIGGMRFDDIAKENGYDKRSVFRQHGNALKSFSEKNPDVCESCH